MSEQQGQPPSAKGRNPAALAIRGLLLVVLIVLLAALLYDRFVAAPQANKAVEAVQGLMETIESPSMGESVEPVTDAVVSRAIGKPSAQREESGKLVIDRFSWRRGLLVTSYNLYVVYQKDSEDSLEMVYYDTSNPSEEVLEGLRPQ